MDKIDYYQKMIHEFAVPFTDALLEWSDNLLYEAADAKTLHLFNNQAENMWNDCYSRGEIPKELYDNIEIYASYSGDLQTINISFRIIDNTKTAKDMIAWTFE